MKDKMSSRERNRRTDEKVDMILKVLRILVGIMIVAIAGVLIFFGIRYRSASKDYEDIRDKAYLIETPDSSDQTGQNTDEDGEAVNPIDFEYLCSINDSCVGYIEACGGDISYPIVHGDDNSFYLKHNFNKESSSSGCLFVRADAIEPFRDYVTYVYGHNMKDGSMFRSLLKYKDEEYLEENRSFMIYTPGEVLKCEIYSVLVVDEANIPEPAAPEGWSLSDGERIVELITCEYSGDNTRLVICAKILSL